jgi:hypothetical protein
MRATSFDFIDRVAKSYGRPHGGLLQLAIQTPKILGFD